MTVRLPADCGVGWWRRNPSSLAANFVSDATESTAQGANWSPDILRKTRGKPADLNIPFLRH